MKAFVVLAALVAVASAGHLGGVAIANTGSSVSTRAEDGHGNYKFAYNEQHATGGSSRAEAGNPWGVVGEYTLNVADGRQRIVKYVADGHGFRAAIKTNEQGTAPQPAAATSIVAPVAAQKTIAAAPIAVAATYAAPAIAKVAAPIGLGCAGWGCGGAIGYGAGLGVAKVAAAPVAIAAPAYAAAPIGLGCAGWGCGGAIGYGAGLGVAKVAAPIGLGYGAGIGKIW